MDGLALADSRARWYCCGNTRAGSSIAGGLLHNGITAGSLVAILMTLFLEVTAPQRSRLEVEADLSALPQIREFIKKFASRNGWDAKMVRRLDAVSREASLRLLRHIASSVRHQQFHDTDIVTVHVGVPNASRDGR